jgi:hypothetical protein
MKKYITYILGGLLIGGIAKYFYDYSKPVLNKEVTPETDLQRLIDGNNRFIKKRKKQSSNNSRILVIKQFTGINPKVIFDSPYVDVISSSIFDHNILKVIENTFYEIQYNTIVILNRDEEGNNAKEYLQELLEESKFLRSLIKSNELKPYWACYNSLSSKVTFYHLSDTEQNKVI